MRYRVAWQQTTAYQAEVDITLPELAAWAIANTELRTLLGVRPSSASLDTLVCSLGRNRHLRARLLQRYADAHKTPPRALGDR